MRALGALHLANTSFGNDKLEHNRKAMEKYGVVVVELQRTLDTNSSHSWLAILATSLLLCMFEVNIRLKVFDHTDANEDFR